MEKTLYVSDLDGTLLDRESKVQKYSENIINSLIAKGMKFTIATARSWNSASKIVKELNLTIPVVTYNGAFLVEPVSGNIIESSWFDKSQVKYAMDALIRDDIYPLVYSFINNEEKVSWFAGKENEGITHYLNSRKGDKRLRKADSIDDLFLGDVFYITAIGSKEELEPITQCFNYDTKFSYTFQQELYREEYWLEIKNSDATKAIGIEKLKKLTGCTKVVSFGDSINDLPMFSVSNEAYAVSNANSELIKIATKVIERADDNGVAKWLKENVTKVCQES